MEETSQADWSCPICKTLIAFKRDDCPCGKFNRRLGPMDGTKTADPKYEHENGFCRGSICLVCNPDSTYGEVAEWHKSGKCHEYEMKNFGTKCRLYHWHKTK